MSEIGTVAVAVKPDFTKLIEGLRILASEFAVLSADAVKAADELEEASAVE
ncbi:hypothetical protein SEA_DARTHPHADER_40 [Mycobacterium phage DarthPhader]|uniref:Uncharacterized protein n=1 Tax=Mycobacterium phage DarthPhader TaxID=1912975 RepID=A0A1I9S3Y6_9CAUD|nr:hypothetical protein KIV60_gp61 [Mycobacterium phage DarthPhader]AOZ61280.1 hypothetical protein SEA_DARTHPHADER_40 [Mycobacterium phage DarthPhader]